MSDKAGGEEGAQRKKKILIVDDEPQFVVVMTSRLKSQNFEIVTALLGKEGIEKVKSQKPDLVLLDVMMPEIDGFAVLSCLKQDPDTKKIPVVMLSAKTSPDFIERAMMLGAADYIGKGISFADLANRLKEILGEVNSPKEQRGFPESI